MLEILFTNWQKQNNQGLCDFKEISKIKTHKLQLCLTGTIYRKFSDHTLIFQAKKNFNTPEILGEPLLYVTEIDCQYKITDLKNEKNNQCLLLLAPTMEQKQLKLYGPFQIDQDSTLRIGKILLKVEKFKTKNLKNNQTLYKKLSKQLMQPIKQVSRSDYKVQSQLDKIQSSTLEVSVLEIPQTKFQKVNYSVQPVNPICKICYSRTFQQHNKLVSLCKCTGSTKFVHENCLKKWIKHSSQLITIEKNNCKSIFIASMKGFMCEICKQYYPLDDIFQLIFNQNQSKFEQFIAISTKNLEKQKIFIINLQEIQEIKIGRDLNNEIILNDMSVSRNHCILKYNPEFQKVELIDLGSKFGTGIIKSSIILTEKKINHKVKLQKGRTYLEIKMQKRKNFLFQKLGICSYQ